MENSKIEWTDNTFNPWIGCTKVSPGCLHCYAETRSKRTDGVKWGKGMPRKRTSEGNWKLPLKWNKDAGNAMVTYRAQLALGAAQEPRRPRVFCASLADWLDDEVPVEWLVDLLKVVHATPNLDWLMLTKRPENFESRIDAAWDHDHAAGERWPWLEGKAPANVWVGTTVEDQARADERIPHLLNIPASVRFLSCEPLLGPVDLTMHHWCAPIVNHLQWVICGGESGPGARPMNPDWARSIRDQCAAAGVPFLFKQWGEHAYDLANPITTKNPGAFCYETKRVGKKAAGRVLDGVTHDAFPAVNA